VNDVCEFIYEKYPKLKEQFNKEIIECWFELYKDKTIVVSDQNKIKGVAMYFTVSDETFEKINQRKVDLSIPANVNSCLAENGKNIHFFMVVSEKMKYVLQGLRRTLEMENIKTISWFSPDMKKVFVRRILCHQS